MDPKDGLEFRISTGLKNILGKELITDNFIAVFELVKNSFDAGASRVTLTFKDIYDKSKASIIIEDNGSGMSLSDISKKWLFVAYSEKKENLEVLDYRTKIPRKVAGAKGVGRFSCDRLGAGLVLVSKKVGAEKAYKLEFDWNKFEGDDSRLFESIVIPYQEDSNWIFPFNRGTSLVITNLREDWRRESLLELKKSLMKLVNPSYGGGENFFEIEIICEDELYRDEKVKEERDRVNGIVENDIIEKLNIKTTSLNVNISHDGRIVKTRLDDRGEMIFIIEEENLNYDKLHDVEFSIFYLNRSAKSNFTKLMGVQPVNYGSIFIYKNGFRIYPFGEPGTDAFKIDRRKAQGYNRYLGTRDLMGRIQIVGDNPDFIESTSRDKGFIETLAIKQLEDFFVKKVIRILEKYVVDTIDWGDPSPEDYNRGVEQGLEPKDIIEKILDNFVRVSKNTQIINVQYGDTIGSYIAASREKNLTSVLNNLERIAKQNNSKALLDLTKRIHNETRKLEKQKIEANREVETIKETLENKQKELVTKNKQIFFLTSTSNKNVEVLVSGYHSIIKAANIIQRYSKILLEDLLKEYGSLGDELQQTIAEIDMSSDKIYKIAQYGLKGNFLQESDLIQEDVYEFIAQYINNFYKNSTKLIIRVTHEGNSSPKCSFGTTSIGMIIDNIVSNSKKNHASELFITIIDEDKSVLLRFRDNGKGLDESIDKVDEIFTFGFSTTRGGYGLGLYHIKKMVESLHGEIFVNMNIQHGFEICIRLVK